MNQKKFDFSGYATRTGRKCTDGRVILKDAFAENDGTTVPLVWQHMHNSPDNVLGHAILENREDGVYAFCSLNESSAGQNAKTLISHGDITALSIYANGLVEKSKSVVHGVIREVSLVLSGANPGAVIDNVTIQHGDGELSELEDEAIIFTGDFFEVTKVEEEKKIEHADKDNETIGEIFETLSEKQKTAVYAIIANVMDEGEGEDEEAEAEHSAINEGDDNKMKHNVFDNSTVKPRPRLTQEQFNQIVETAKQVGSFKQAFLAHAGTYGVDNLDYLFPDAQALTKEPTFIKRDTEWVSKVLNGARHTPFSRIKSVHADITADEARAKGYVTAALKIDEVFGLLKRVTGPTTVYKKQKLDRNDIVDITDLDVVAWLKREMRFMLDEELAGAGLVGDRRLITDPDYIDRTCIRPIWLDDALYSYKLQMLSTDDTEDIIEKIIRGRKYYKGSGNPTLFTTTDFLTDMLLLKDLNGHRLYKTEAELAATLRVSGFVEVPVMENLSRVVETTTYNLLGILVNMSDYTYGADKGGEVNFFDDFDIDYNQYKYLLETRCSGALTLPYSAQVIEQEAGD